MFLAFLHGEFIIFGILLVGVLFLVECSRSVCLEVALPHKT